MTPRNSILNMKRFEDDISPRQVVGSCRLYKFGSDDEKAPCVYEARTDSLNCRGVYKVEWGEIPENPKAPDVRNRITKLLGVWFGAIQPTN
eukprot:CAMPEP_0184700486 /NCGR_PEP_ID=MMETSP0313-20130426/13738_1 /TAXON_ID=2792 /ORGANISM="Porphyridium aerugineum, Strain SAG 1380-2" /LENGTH=90 /DNA_ID=CAMNT_0027160187 /DNA_START=56 /DNA_END=328 /DNA_ORIENTATION=+